MNNAIDDISNKIKTFLSKKIQSSKENFNDSQNFNLTEYDMEFNLERVDGSYESSLPLLISKIMFHEGYYAEVLDSILENDSANEAVTKMINEVQEESPNEIFGFDMDMIDEGYDYNPPVNFEEVDDAFNTINFNVCKHVGEMLQEYDFFDPEGFENMGYFEDDDDSLSDDLPNDGEKVMYLMQCGYDDNGLEGEDLLAIIAKEIASLSETIKNNIDLTSIYLLVGEKGEPFSDWPRTAIEILSEDQGVDYIDNLEPLFEHPSGFTSLVLSKLKPDYGDYLLLRSEDYNYDFTIAFYASETDDEDLWSYVFNRIAKSHGDIKIIGSHSHHNGEYAIQYWSDGYYDEGVDSNPDSKDFYLGLEGDNIKYEKLSEEAFDISTYTVIKS